MSIENYKALKHVIHNSKIELKGDAVTKVAALFKWYDSLEEIFKEQPKELKIEKIKNDKVKR